MTRLHDVDLAGPSRHDGISYPCLAGSVWWLTTGLMIACTSIQNNWSHKLWMQPALVKPQQSQNKGKTSKLARATLSSVPACHPVACCMDASIHAVVMQTSSWQCCSAKLVPDNLRPEKMQQTATGLVTINCQTVA